MRLHLILVDSIENCVQKKRKIALSRILLTCIQLRLLQFLQVIWSIPTNFAVFKKPLDKFLYKFGNPEINCHKNYTLQVSGTLNRGRLLNRASKKLVILIQNLAEKLVISNFDITNFSARFCIYE